MKQTAVTFRQAKGQRKLAMLTAYDATVARLMDDHVDAVLVGDSLGMVMLGQPDGRSGAQWKGIGQAKAVVFFLIVVVISLIQLHFTRSKEVQQ